MSEKPPAFSSSISPEAAELIGLMWAQRGWLSLSPPASMAEWPAWRERVNAGLRPPPAALAAFGTRCEVIDIGGVPVHEILPQAHEHPDCVLLFTHGGGYVVGEPNGGSAHLLANATGLRVLSIDYRKAPDHPFPAAQDDALAVYREVVARHGAARVAWAGVSAGAGLALSTLVRARDAGVPMPAAVAALCAWLDLAPDGDSITHLSGPLDPLGSYQQSGLDDAARAYAGALDLRHPGVSPLHADYTPGLCPVQLVTGTRDWLMSQSALLQARLKRARVPVDLELWEGMGHGFMSLPVPEGRESMRNTAEFLRNHLHIAR